MRSMELRAGTSGFSYKEWKGSFYPEKLPAKQMLGYYAERLPAVEINNTFYRMPKASVLESWAEQVPEGFRFALKASRRITHFKRLKDAGDETGYVLGTAAALGERLGAVLFQLPPNLRCDLPRLEAFLEHVPEGTPAVFEFRHESWQEDGVLEALRARNFALCVVDAEGAPELELVATASRGYLRLRRESYAREDLAGWATRIAAQPWDEALVFLKHEDGATGPRLAAELLELAAREAERKAPLPARGATRRRETG